MTADDAIKTGFGLVAAGIAAVLGWLARMTVGNREKLLQMEAKQEAFENSIKAHFTSDEKALSELKAGLITTERLREVIDAALDKRDKIAAERRGEWDRRLQLEMRQVVQEELEHLLPRFVSAWDRRRDPSPRAPRPPSGGQKLGPPGSGGYPTQPGA